MVLFSENSAGIYHFLDQFWLLPPSKVSMTEENGAKKMIPVNLWNSNRDAVKLQNAKVDKIQDFFLFSKLLLSRNKSSKNADVTRLDKTSSLSTDVHDNCETS